MGSDLIYLDRIMWIERKSPSRIERRFEFESYTKISLFMERIENLCKENEIYPNISFGKTFVSVTIFLEDEPINQRFTEFSKIIDEIYKS